MDPAGGTASIITLLGTAISITKITVDLLQTIQNAPQELQEILIKISVIRTQLEQLNGIKESLGQSDDQILSTIFRKTIESSLEITRKASLKAHDALQPLKDKTGLASRVQWALLDRGRVEKLSRKLQDAQQSLGLALQILEIQISLFLKNSVLEIRADLDQLLANVSCVEKNIRGLQLQLGACDQADHRCCCLRKYTNVSSKPSLDPLYKNSPKLSTYYFLRISIWGGRAQCQSIVTEQTKSNFTIDLPLNFSGSRVFTVKVSIRHLSPSCWGFRLEKCSLAIRNLVPDDSRIMDACEKGDLLVARELFQKGQANPNDVTHSGFMPLMYAIKAGKHDIVRYLIEAGANVNAEFGESQTNSLQLAAQHGYLDIFRTLLAEQASADHIDARGWTVAFHLWAHHAIQQQARTDFLKLLHIDGGCDIKAVGPGNWTALHRAAVAGTAEDVSTLIKYGADVRLRTQGLDWSPVHHAALAGNTAVMVELAKQQRQTDINSRDARGWSPLHIAAYCGTVSTLTTLLELGASPHDRTYRTYFQVPKCITGKRVTPEEVAKDRGEDQHRVYLEALRQSMAASSILEDADIFWDAPEHL